jgi:hypothetical protein
VILEDIESLEEKIEELDSKASSKLLESNDIVELRINSLEAFLREALKGLKDAQNESM